MSRNETLESFKAALRERMTGGGDYLICDQKGLAQIRLMAKPGDTISCHREPRDPPTLYEVTQTGALRPIWPLSAVS